jgi:hypothetical protein
MLMFRSQRSERLFTVLRIEVREKPAAKIIIEKLDLHGVMVGRLLRLGTAIDDDLVQHRELGAKPVLPCEPLQIGRIVDEQLLD